MDVTDAGPWYRRHPAGAGVVAVVLFVAVTGLQIFGSGPQDATVMLYALPVALVAMAWGRFGGIVAAAASLVLLCAWVAGSGDVALTPLGWAARIVPLALLGYLVGSAADAETRSASHRMSLAVADRQRRSAAEVNDSILQRLSVAKWQLEAGVTGPALELLESAIEDGQRLVAELLADAELEDRLRVHAVPAASSPPDLV